MWRTLLLLLLAAPELIRWIKFALGWGEHIEFVSHNAPAAWKAVLVVINSVMNPPPYASMALFVLAVMLLVWSEIRRKRGLPILPSLTVGMRKLLSPEADEPGDRRAIQTPETGEGQGAKFALSINVHGIFVQMPRLKEKLIHINVELFNGNAEDIYLMGINGSVSVAMIEKNDSPKKLGKLTVPSFSTTRRNHIPAHDEFSFLLEQEVPNKFAEALSDWNSETKYQLDFEALNIIVQSTSDPKKATRLPLWDAVELSRRDGRIIAAKIIKMRPGTRMRGLSPLEVIETPTPEPEIPPVEQVPRSTTVRTAFSATQSIKALPPSLGGNMTLRLDNIATMRLHSPSSMSFVTLLLDVVPMDAAVKHGPDIQVEGAQIYYGKREKFLFDADRNNRKEITVAGRCFVVTLLQINKLQIANVANPIEYVFGISEK